MCIYSQKKFSNFSSLLFWWFGYFQLYLQKREDKIMKNIYFKVTYPDGDYEYWTSVEKEEVKRLEKVNGGKLIIEKVAGVEYE